jgi:hypothetical protein
MPNYADQMSDSPLSPWEVRAAAETHEELGPEYSDAVVASFLDKVDRAVAARVDAHLADMRQPAPPAEPDDRRAVLKGIAIGVCLSALTLMVVGGAPDGRLHRLIWLLPLLAAGCAIGATWDRRPRRLRRPPTHPAVSPGSDQRMS